MGNTWSVATHPVIAAHMGAGATSSSTLAVVNQKGGVGKTTTAVNLSAALALLGHLLLLVDLDPQGNSTSGLGVSKSGLRLTVYEALVSGGPIDSCIQRTGIDGLDIAPSDVRLAGAEVELVSSIAREAKLRSALRSAQDRYDAILVDCPPSLGLLTVNALTAANACLIPLQPEYYALEGLSALMTTIELVRKHLNPPLTIAGLLLTMVDSRTKLSDQVAEEVRRHFGDRVFQTLIPRSVRLAEAPSYGESIFTYAPESRGAAAYHDLAREAASRLGLRPAGQTSSFGAGWPLRVGVNSGLEEGGDDGDE
jgi:chromosome partitioning protein